MALSDQAAFLRSLVYTREATVSALRADVAGLRDLDKHYEGVGRTWLLLGVLFTIAFVGSLFWLAAEEARGITPYVAGGTFVLTCAAWITKRHYGKFNTEDRRYELLGEVLPLLATDLADDARLRVRLDLLRADHKSKFKRKGQAGVWKVKFYEDPWLRLEGRFLDGTAFLLEVVEYFQHRGKWSRSSSGKSKYKSKTKSATAFRLRLRPRAKRYQHLGTLAPSAAKAVQLPAGADPKGVSCEDGSLGLTCKLKRDWKAGLEGERTVALMFLSLYQILNLSRHMTRKAG